MCIDSLLSKSSLACKLYCTAALRHIQRINSLDFEHFDYERKCFIIYESDGEK